MRKQSRRSAANSQFSHNEAQIKDLINDRQTVDSTDFIVRAGDIKEDIHRLMIYIRIKYCKMGAEDAFWRSVILLDDNFDVVRQYSVRPVGS